MAACLALAVACGGPASGGDAGMMDDGWTPPGVEGTVVLLAPTTEAPSLPVRGFWVRIATLGLVGDRDPALDPHVDGIGWVQIGDAGLEEAVGDVPPALYSAVAISLADGPTESGMSVLDLQLDLDDGLVLDLSTSMPLDLVARCEHGAVVNTTDAVRIGVDFALADAVAAAITEPLPAPDSHGVIHADDVTAPEAIAEFRHYLAERIHAECGPDGT